MARIDVDRLRKFKVSGLLRGLMAGMVGLLPGTSHSAPTDAALRLLAKVYHQPISYRVVSTDQLSVAGLLACQQREIELTSQDPISAKPRTVRFKQFAMSIAGVPPRNPESMPTVVINPPIGGTDQIDTTYSNALCFLGFRVVLLETWDFANQSDIDLDSHDRNTLRSVTAIGNVLDYLNPIRANQIGLLGTSAGAITGALATGYDARISAAALIVGGGNLADIIATSDLEQFSQLRNLRMKTLGFASIDRYRDALKAHILFDPIDFTSFSGAKKIWMTIATKDTTVPTIDQFDLYRAFGSQELHTFAGGHLETVINSAFTDSSEVVDFFVRNIH